MLEVGRGLALHVGIHAEGGILGIADALQRDDHRVLQRCALPPGLTLGRHLEVQPESSSPGSINRESDLLDAAGRHVERAHRDRRKRLVVPIDDQGLHGQAMRFCIAVDDAEGGLLAAAGEEEIAGAGSLHADAHHFAECRGAFPSPATRRTSSTR